MRPALRTPSATRTLPPRVTVPFNVVAPARSTTPPTQTLTAPPEPRVPKLAARTPRATLPPAAPGRPGLRSARRDQALPGLQARSTTPPPPINTVSARLAVRATPRTWLCAPRTRPSAARSLPPRVTAPPPVAVPIRSTTPTTPTVFAPLPRAPRAPLLTLLPAASPAHRPSAKRSGATSSGTPLASSTIRLGLRTSTASRLAVRAAPRTRLCAPRPRARVTSTPEA